MSNAQQLPPPSLNITRQVATGLLGSPVTLSREVSTTSNRSDARRPDQVMLENLIHYRVYLEHEIDFLDNEIQALIQRPPSQNPVEDTSLLRLRDELKIRYNNMRAKHVRLLALLEVME
jgi:hypothetical protein